MSSSFQEKNELLEYEDVYSNVLALYCTLKGSPKPQSIKRAELNASGEVTAEAIDFIADVELKAKRQLNSTQYRLFLKFAAEEKYESVPKSLKQLLGLRFLRSDLNYDGAYRVLYYKAKNNKLYDREEPRHFPEESVNAEDMLQ
jgi:hypothetical protein